MTHPFFSSNDWLMVLQGGGAMGCGGSRMDVLEPHYLESWTKDTESTWLASTDTDIPLSSIQSLASESSFDTGFTSEKTSTPGEGPNQGLTDNQGCVPIPVLP